MVLAGISDSWLLLAIFCVAGLIELCAILVLVKRIKLMKKKIPANVLFCQ